MPPGRSEGAAAYVHSCVQFAAVDASALDNATFLAGFVPRFSEQMAGAAGANTDAVVVETVVGGSLLVTSRVWFNDATVVEPEAFATRLLEDVSSIFTSEARPLVYTRPPLQMF
eukprot:gene5679-6864_t